MGPPSFRYYIEFVWVIVAMVLTRMSTADNQHKIAEHGSPAERQGILIRNLRSYEIDHPVITNDRNSHLGYLTDGRSRRRRKRAINVVGEHDPFHYKFRADGQEYFMKLRINTELFGPDFKVENFYEDDKVETEKMEEHCYLVGETIPHNYSVAISDCDGLYGVVSTEEDVVYIEPLINNSYLDTSKLKGNGRPHLIYKQSQLPKLDPRINPLDFRNIAPARSKTSPKRNVHYSYVKFINRSGRMVKLMWLDQRKREAYFATLMPGTSRVVNTFTLHRWIAVDEETGQRFLIGPDLLYKPKKNKPTARANVYIKLPAAIKLAPTSEKEIRKKIGVKYIESMAVADKSVVSFHGKDRVARYIMALMNVVSYVFKHKSIGIEINYVLVRIVLLHKDPKEVSLSSAHPNKSLLTACGFMHKIRKGRTDDEPHFHDHATFLTRKSFGPAAGYAPVYGMCHPTRSCTLNGEDGFPSAFIIAHEAGHSLGMEHDGESNRCKADTGRGSIMAPLVQARINRYHWSSCSRKELMSSIRNFHCLNDKPNNKYKKDLPFLHTHPGVHYSTDDQCLFDFGPGYKFCRAFHRDPCLVLWCNMPEPFKNLCKSMRAPALNGTKCGEKKWCLSGRCVAADESITEPPPIDGMWGDWGEWKACTKECGVGLRIRERSCNRPAPRYGGIDCVGKSKEEDVCNAKRCEHPLPLHENELKKQCSLIGKQKGSYRQWSFYDESKVNLNCTFEYNLCSWVNLRRDDERDFEFNKGPTKTARTGPSVDHTTNGANGRYIYFESSNPAKSGHRARISSPDLGIRRGCLSFWYHMYGGKDMGTLRVLMLNAKGTTTLWSKTGDHGDEWFQGRVDIKADSLYNLVIEAQRSRSYLSDIALDDVMFTSGPCDTENRDGEGSVNPCVVSCLASGKILMDNPVITGVRCYDNGSLDICVEGKCRDVGCDGVMDSEKEFDNCGVCGGNGSSCELRAGKITRTTRKDFDLLLSIPKGSSNINVKKNRNSNHMLVLTVKDPKNSGVEYHVVKGNDVESPPAIYSAVGTQFVYTNDHGEQTIKSLGAVDGDVSVKVRQGRGNSVELKYEYFDMKEEIQNKEDNETQIETVIDAPHVKNISKQNVSEEVAVTNSTPTTAENIIIEVVAETRWVITKDWTPCSRSCGKGASFLKYFCKVGDKVVPRSRCRHLKLNVDQKFKYCNTHPCGGTFNWSKSPWSVCSKNCSVGNMTREVTCRKQPGDIAVFNTSCKEQKPSETKPCFVKACPLEWTTGNWSECSTTCGVGSQTRDVSCTDDQGRRIIGCDEENRPEARQNCRKPACPIETEDPLDCDFEKDLCKWQQMKDDRFDWIRNKGRTKSSETGPSNDHTLKNRKGYYLYVEASNKHKKDDVIRLVSPEVNSPHACLKFFYHMKGREIGELRVRLLTKAGYSEGFTWVKRRHQGGRWTEAEVDIPGGLAYKVVIEGVLNKGWRGDMAIDDINFHREKCGLLQHKNAKNVITNRAGSRNPNLNNT